jgi:hypothetical protein
MMKCPDPVPRKIEKATDFVPPCDAPDLRDWEPANFWLQWRFKAASVFQDRENGARMNTDLCASF